MKPPVETPLERIRRDMGDLTQLVFAQSSQVKNSELVKAFRQLANDILKACDRAEKKPRKRK